MVLPADKGRASVVLDTETYRQKMKTLIDSVPYRLLNQDLTNRLSRKTFGQRTHSHRVGGLDINYFKGFQSSAIQQLVKLLMELGNLPSPARNRRRPR